jgi:hypothetical protein
MLFVSIKNLTPIDKWHSQNIQRVRTKVWLYPPIFGSGEDESILSSK